MKFDMLNIVIYEDDEKDAAATCRVLQEWCRKQDLTPLFSIHSDPKESLQELEKADLLVLDMEIQGQSGIDLGKKIRREWPDLTIVITSAHTAYLEKGYTLRAARYFLKPLHPELVFLEMDDLLEEAAFIQRKKVADIRLAKIASIEFQDRKCVFTLIDGRQLVRSMALQQVADQVEGCGFACCHKGILVNLSQVKSLSQTAVELKSQKRLPLSRRNRKGFQKAWEAWIL